MNAIGGGRHATADAMPRIAADVAEAANPTQNLATPSPLSASSDNARDPTQAPISVSTARVSGNDSRLTGLAHYRRWFWRQARKIVVAVIGTTFILAGVVMLLVPGPGWATIIAGLMVLATEFVWAAWVLKQARSRVHKWASDVAQATESQPEDDPAAAGRRPQNRWVVWTRSQISQWAKWIQRLTTAAPADKLD
jgi:hypothetical protein